MGGGVNLDNAEAFLDAGASHVIVTSFVFRAGQFARSPGITPNKRQAKMSPITWPWTSVRRRSMPLWRKVRASWSMPSKWRIVAWMS
ncbi:MAG: hypothetical protein ACI8W8_003483 [Rhodothermales bacterium]|jgi:hypothetical protein